MNVRQTAIGTNIDQSTHIYNRPLDLVDICADKIEALLDKISHINFFVDNNSRLRPPDIDTKNELNGLGAAEVYVVEGTYAVWDDITTAIRADASGKLANEYNKASYILNQLYLASFLKSFAEFKVHVVGIYCQANGGTSDEAFLLIHLLHYMYLSCQVGIKP